ncbi:hypothetical protein RJ639_019496 [Escallonia herrerae]|uniref:Cytochrome P450 n=1 Tax=Escallonia herrerae TaxID=1293975 RepID=A0AA88V8S7_9ASTE|nr:hypothetical protein RJ639_019496 [Escallonia herrerae]
MDTLQDIFIAGSETSSTTLEWAMSEMLKPPRVIERAQAEVSQPHNHNVKDPKHHNHQPQFHPGQ